MREIRFGWIIPAQAGADLKESHTFVDQIMGGLEAIQGKFDSVWVTDHFHPPIEGSGNELDVLECMTTIAYLAGVFDDFDFGSIVLGQSYRNPALLAKMGAHFQKVRKARNIECFCHGLDSHCARYVTRWSLRVSTSDTGSQLRNLPRVCRTHLSPWGVNPLVPLRSAMKDSSCLSTALN